MMWLPVLVICRICIMMSVGHVACPLSSTCFVNIELLFWKERVCSLNLV